MGRSAVGKDTLVAALCEKYNLKRLVSYTTRPKRIGEADTHIFISKKDFPLYKDDIVAYTKIGEYEYFATRQQLDDCDFYIIDPIGYMTLHQDYNLAKSYRFVPIMCTLPEGVRSARSAQRRDERAVYEARSAAEDKEFVAFDHWDLCDENKWYVDTTDLDSAMDEVMKIIKQSEFTTRLLTNIGIRYHRGV